jgi:hypothetical protein
VKKSRSKSNSLVFTTLRVLAWNFVFIRRYLKIQTSLSFIYQIGNIALFPPTLKVAVDKRTAYDDGRGMGEGVLDSRPTRHRYILLLEPRAAPAAAEQSERADVLPALSPLALTLARQLESPLSIFLYQPQQQEGGGGGRRRKQEMKHLPELGNIQQPWLRLLCLYDHTRELVEINYV